MGFESPAQRTGSSPAQIGVGVVEVVVVVVSVFRVVELVVHALHRAGQMILKALLTAQKSCDAWEQSAGSFFPWQLTGVTSGVCSVAVVGAAVVVGQLPHRILHKDDPSALAQGSNALAVQPVGSSTPSHNLISTSAIVLC
jgi:hypothetical protein